MNVIFDSEKLHRLISNLYLLTGIWCNILDADGRELRICGEQRAFCQSVNGTPEGAARCHACDQAAIRRCNAAGGVHAYRCHAGLCELVLPVMENGAPIAYLFLGQLLDNTARRSQWAATQKSLSWYPGDMAALKAQFFALDQRSEAELCAYAEILEALTSYILFDGVIRSAEFTEPQALDRYLDEHYTEKLTLSRIAGDLHMGTTKLCALAQRLSDGGTLSKILSAKRVRAAKPLLLQTDLPISAISERVGMDDYNYFTKIFKAAEGVTPSQYRREHR